MPTGAGKLSVSKDISDQWATGDRDQLTLALVQALNTGFEGSRLLQHVGHAKARTGRVICDQKVF